MNPAEHTPAEARPGPAAPGQPSDGAAAPDGDHLRRPRPGFTAGEREIQRRLDTVEQADRFRREQMLDHLNARMREFVRRQEMFFLATADAGGHCDNSLRAGPPGFLHVLDERTLVYPEYRGNGVHASLGNILENPHVGILLVDFLQARIGLHVNGRAELVEDAELRARHPELPVDPVPGRRARVWVRVTVEEAYLHCATHIPHLQKAQGAARAWGTDDYQRRGGDFFGVAREARRRSAPRERPAPVPARSAAPLPAAELASTPDPAAWRQEAERALDEARRRGRSVEQDTPFRGWFG